MNEQPEPTDAQRQMDEGAKQAYQEMMDEAMAEAKAALADNPEERAKVEANYAQLLRASQEHEDAETAVFAGDLEQAAASERQKRAELDDLVVRAGRDGSIIARISSWFIRPSLKR